MVTRVLSATKVTLRTLGRFTITIFQEENHLNLKIIISPLKIGGLYLQSSKGMSNDVNRIIVWAG